MLKLKMSYHINRYMYVSLVLLMCHRLVIQVFDHETLLFGVNIFVIYPGERPFIYVNVPLL